MSNVTINGKNIMDKDDFMDHVFGITNSIALKNGLPEKVFYYMLGYQRAMMDMRFAEVGQSYEEIAERLDSTLEGISDGGYHEQIDR